MRKRNVDKHIWFDRQEAQDLQKKAKKACLTEAALIRLLIRGYEPREKPDERFYDAMRELSAIGNNINQLAIKANALGFVDSQMLKNEALRWHKFQAAIEREFLRPEKREVHASIGAVLYELRVGGEIVGFAVFQHEQPFRLQQSAAEHQGGKFFQAG